MAEKNCKKEVAENEGNDLPTVFDYSTPKWNFDDDGTISPACTSEELRNWTQKMTTLCA